MSAFTENALVKKLSELNSSQQSIQTLSLWLIHHRKHHVGIIKTWYRELQKAPEAKKLIFMYLANDVIQNSKKKGPEYGKEYGNVLNKVLSHIGETCSSEKLFTNLGRILNIWEERGVYEADVIKEFKTRLFRNKEIIVANKKQEKQDSVKRKSKETHKSSSKKSKSSSVKEVLDQVDAKEQNGTAETVKLSPHIPLGDPPEPEELINALNALENSASSDVAIREKIANFPPEISEIATLSKLEDKETAAKLSKQVNEAVILLNDYNARLVSEMEDRKKLSSMLRNFQAEQKELLLQAEQRLEEYTQKLNKVKQVQKEICDHLSNLPDLTQLPDVTGGLAPLPSAGDLFNVH